MTNINPVFNLIEIKNFKTCLCEEKPSSFVHKRFVRRGNLSSLELTSNQENLIYSGVTDCFNSNKRCFATTIWSG